MVTIENVKKILDYCSDKLVVSLPELQYELKFTYTLTRDLISFFKERGWLYASEGALRVNHDMMPPIKLSAVKRDKFIKNIKTRKLNMKLIEELVERGSLTYIEISTIIEARIPTLGKMHATQLCNAGVAYILGETVYPMIDNEMLEYIKNSK